MNLPLVLSIVAAHLVGGAPHEYPLPPPTLPTQATRNLTWQLTTTGSAQRFRGLSPVSGDIAWVAGTNGTILRTLDAGRTWASVGPALAPADAELQFRDVEAWSADAAAALSIGEGNQSRVYTTRDGGATWAVPFVNGDDAAFYDCLAFDGPEHGMAVSDPVDGKFRLLETREGGRSWDVIDPSGMPEALDGEFGFAGSGTCLSAAKGRWYLASGGVDPGRIFRSADGGRSWDVSDSSVAGGAAAGVFSVVFADTVHGIAVGGDYESPNITDRISAWSGDGGVTWTPSTKYPGGYRSGSSWVPGQCGVALAVGPTGSDITFDGGETWRVFDSGSFDSVQCVEGRVCWASGEAGRVARLIL
ncbi:hypothetical protein LQW54_011909 [Pestalotiopsis sp. IQ-011]